MPIVLAPTTFGDHLNIGVTYRTAGFSRAKIDTLMDIYREQIEHPNKASRGELPRRPAAARDAETIAPRLQGAFPTAEQRGSVGIS